MNKNCKLVIPQDVEHVYFGGLGYYRIKLEMGSSIKVQSQEEGATTLTVTSIEQIEIAGEKYSIVEFASDNWEICPTYHISKISS